MINSPGPRDITQRGSGSLDDMDASAFLVLLVERVTNGSFSEQ